MPGLLQVREALSREGNPHREREGECHTGFVRGMRGVREGLSGACEENPERSSPDRISPCVRRQSLRVDRAELRRIFQGCVHQPACGGARQMRIRACKRNRPWSGGRKRKSRPDPSRMEFPSHDLKRVSGVRGLHPQIQARICPFHIARSIAAQRPFVDSPRTAWR